MPLVDVKKIRGKFRLVEQGTTKIAKMERSGAPRDGGGHSKPQAAYRQKGYVNEAIKKMGYD